jgi:CheY-like chemotaxis protein
MQFESRAEDVVLVILDMAMPVMSGDEAHRRLKSIRPKIPILVTSGYSEPLAKAR